MEVLVDRCEEGGMSDTPRGRVAVANAPALLIRVENAFATIVVIALLQVLLVLVVVTMSL